MALDPALAAAADSGVKAMIPIGRPFLDYVLGVAADAGITRACLVVGPEHGQMQKYYTELRPRRISIEFAVRVKPRGTADAVAAEPVVRDPIPFVMINSGQLLPAFSPLRLADAGAGPPSPVFDQETLVAQSNDCEAGGLFQVFCRQLSWDSPRLNLHCELDAVWPKFGVVFLHLAMFGPHHQAGPRYTGVGRHP